MPKLPAELPINLPFRIPDIIAKQWILARCFPFLLHLSFDWLDLIEKFWRSDCASGDLSVWDLHVWVLSILATLAVGVSGYLRVLYFQCKIYADV